jgi:CMP-2-keto-3-deoxyoctulosonic acid synthetase
LNNLVYQPKVLQLAEQVELAIKVMSKQNEALYFSRATIPYDRDGAKHDEPTLHSQVIRNGSPAKI